MHNTHHPKIAIRKLPSLLSDASLKEGNIRVSFFYKVTEVGQFASVQLTYRAFSFYAFTHFTQIFYAKYCIKIFGTAAEVILKLVL